MVEDFYNRFQEFLTKHALYTQSPSGLNEKQQGIVPEVFSLHLPLCGKCVVRDGFRSWQFSYWMKCLDRYIQLYAWTAKSMSRDDSSFLRVQKELNDEMDRLAENIRGYTKILPEMPFLIKENFQVVVHHEFPTGNDCVNQRIEAVLRSDSSLDRLAILSSLQHVVSHPASLLHQWLWLNTSSVEE